MTWLQYIFQHLIPTWFRSFNDNFRMWADLMTDNFENYALLKDDDPFQECYEWFWTSINLDETYPKEFLEYLQKMADDVASGKVKTYSWEEVKEKCLEWSDKVLEGVDLNEELKDDDDI